MKALIVMLLVTTAAGAATAQEPSLSSTQFTIKSSTDQPLTFRIAVQGAGVRVSGAGMVARFEGNTQVVDITAPATLDIAAGEGALEIRLVSAATTPLELSPLPNRMADDRSLFVTGTTVVLRRSAGSRRIDLVYADGIISRRRLNQALVPNAF